MKKSGSEYTRKSFANGKTIFNYLLKHPLVTTINLNKLVDNENDDIPEDRESDNLVIPYRVKIKHVRIMSQSSSLILLNFILNESNKTLQTLTISTTMPAEDIYFKKLWKIDLLCNNKQFRFDNLGKNFPILQIIYPDDQQFRLSVITQSGKICRGYQEDILRFLEYNKNKMRCTCLIYWKFKQIFGRDVAKLICDLLLYKNDCPENWVPELKDDDGKVLTGSETNLLFDLRNNVDDMLTIGATRVVDSEFETSDIRRISDQLQKVNEFFGQVYNKKFKKC